MRYQTVAFDLDGTLIDSSEGVLRCVQYALEKLGKPVPPMTELTGFMGPPLYDGFSRFGGCNHEEALRAVDLYRERYRPIGIHENRLYAGIPALLKALKAAGCTVAVATSKPQDFAVQILEELGLTSCFDHIIGSDFAGKLPDKASVLRLLRSRLTEAERAQMVLVGDRHHDADGAKEVGIPCIGVLYGFGTAAEFATAETTVDTVEELQAYLLS